MQLLNLYVLSEMALYTAEKGNKKQSLEHFVLYDYICAVCVYIKKEFERIFSNLTGSLETDLPRGSRTQTTFFSAFYTSEWFGFFADSKY